MSAGANCMLFVGVLNAIWVLFGVFGMYVSIRLILEGGYGVLGILRRGPAGVRHAAVDRGLLRVPVPVTAVGALILSTVSCAPDDLSGAQRGSPPETAQIVATIDSDAPADDRQHAGRCPLPGD